MVKRETFDVCVIGTGAGGGVMIQELAAAGFRVVALQRGPFLQKSDFAPDELRTVIRDEVFRGDAAETWRASEGDAAMPGRFTGTAHCVGGTSARWGGWAWRYRHDDFRVASTEGGIEGASLADWPIDPAGLEPFYERAEADLGVAGEAGANPFADERRKAYPNPPHAKRVASLAVETGARSLGLHPFPVPLAINPRAFARRPACSWGGTCWGYGCPVDAKASSLTVAIPRALATGRLDLRPNAVARELVPDQSGRVRSVRYLDWKGEEQELFARFFVLAGGGIGSPHLLLMSRSGTFPHGLANSSGEVGRNLTFQMTSQVGFLIEEPAMGWLGASGHVAVDDFHASDAKRGFVRGGVIVETNAPSSGPLAYAFRGLPGARATRSWGAELKRLLQTYPRAVFLSAVLEDLPMASNAIDLDPDVKDGRGLPAARITHRQHPNDLRQHAWFTAKLLEIAEAAGGTERWVVDRPGVTTIGERVPARGGDTALGTCRMGKDPSRSVVDADGRAHDVPNLWIVDGSVLPTPGGYNPGLTIFANAYRVAARFVAQARRGRPGEGAE